MWPTRAYLTDKDAQYLKDKTVKRDFGNEEWPRATVNPQIATFLNQLLRILLPIGSTTGDSNGPSLNDVERKIHMSECFHLECGDCVGCAKCTPERKWKGTELNYFTGAFEEDEVRVLNRILVFVFRRIAEKAYKNVITGSTLIDAFPKVMEPFRQWLNITLLANWVRDNNRALVSDPWDHSQVKLQLREEHRSIEDLINTQENNKQLVEWGKSAFAVVGRLDIRNIGEFRSYLLRHLDSDNLVNKIEEEFKTRPSPEDGKYTKAEYSRRFSKLLILQCGINWKGNIHRSEHAGPQRPQTVRLTHCAGQPINEFDADRNAKLLEDDVLWFEKDSTAALSIGNKVFCGSKLRTSAEAQEHPFKIIGNLRSDLRLLNVFNDFVSQSDIIDQVLSGEVKSDNRHGNERPQDFDQAGFHIIRSERIADAVFALLGNFLSAGKKVVLCAPQNSHLVDVLRVLQSRGGINGEALEKTIVAWGRPLGAELGRSSSLRDVARSIIVESLRESQDNWKRAVLCSTLTSLRKGLPEFSGRTVAIIANADMATEPESLIPMALGCTTVILVGDGHGRPHRRVDGLNVSLMGRLLTASDHRGRDPPTYEGRRAKSAYATSSDPSPLDRFQGGDQMAHKLGVAQAAVFTSSNSDWSPKQMAFLSTTTHNFLDPGPQEANHGDSREEKRQRDCHKGLRCVPNVDANQRELLSKQEFVARKMCPILAGSDNELMAVCRSLAAGQNPVDADQRSSIDAHPKSDRDGPSPRRDRASPTPPRQSTRDDDLGNTDSDSEVSVEIEGTVETRLQNARAHFISLP